MKLDLSSYTPYGVEPIERASRDEIAARQTARIKATLARVYDNVPAYRNKFDAARVHPSDFSALEDLAKFPFTTKQDLRDNYPFGMFAVPREQVLRLHASSGTTGKATVVGYTRNDLDIWADLVARCIRTSGGRPGMCVHVAAGYGLFTGGLGMHYGAERLGCTVIPVGAGMTARHIQIILDFKPDILIPTASYMLTLLDEMRTQGIDPCKTSPKIAVLGAEPWGNAMRAEIERSSGIHAVDTYGLSEVIGPGVSAECIEEKDGLYIWEDHFYPEIIDPQTGRVLPDGKHGELVFTTLTKEAMPVIRYRTRDLTRLMSGRVRSFRRMEKVSGRSDDMIIVRGINVFPTQIEELVLRCEGLAPHYLIELRTEERRDVFRVLTEARPGYAQEEARDAQGQLLAQHIREAIGLRAEVTVGAPGVLERSVGKAKRVNDLRARN
jgi:phenylacetate-CoA ligase